MQELDRSLHAEAILDASVCPQAARWAAQEPVPPTLLSEAELRLFAADPRPAVAAEAQAVLAARLRAGAAWLSGSFVLRHALTTGPGVGRWGWWRPRLKWLARPFLGPYRLVDAGVSLFRTPDINPGLWLLWEVVFPLLMAHIGRGLLPRLVLAVPPLARAYHAFWGFDAATAVGWWLGLLVGALVLGWQRLTLQAEYAVRHGDATSGPFVSVALLAPLEAGVEGVCAPLFTLYRSVGVVRTVLAVGLMSVGVGLGGTTAAAWAAAHWPRWDVRVLAIVGGMVVAGFGTWLLLVWAGALLWSPAVRHYLAPADALPVATVPGIPSYVTITLARLATPAWAQGALARQARIQLPQPWPDWGRQWGLDVLPPMIRRFSSILAALAATVSLPINTVQWAFVPPADAPGPASRPFSATVTLTERERRQGLRWVAQARTVLAAAPARRSPACAACWYQARCDRYAVDLGRPPLTGPLLGEAVAAASAGPMPPGAPDVPRRIRR